VGVRTQSLEVVGEVVATVYCRHVGGTGGHRYQCAWEILLEAGVAVAVRRERGRHPDALSEVDRAKNHRVQPGRRVSDVGDVEQSSCLLDDGDYVDRAVEFDEQLLNQH